MSQPAVPDSPDTHKSSHITSHAFSPNGEWWSRCKICNIAEAAHRDTSLTEDDRILAPRAKKQEPPAKK